MKWILGAPLLLALGAFASPPELTPDEEPQERSTTCSRDSHCREGDPDTVDWCYEDEGECHNKYRGDCTDHYSYCDKDKHCLDGDSSTKDWCYGKKCHHSYRDTGYCKY